MGSSAWAESLWETLALPSVSTTAVGHPGTAHKDFALGSPKAQDNCSATHLRNGLFGLEVGTGHSIVFVCLKGSQRNYHSKNCIALLYSLCCLQKWDFSLGWQPHTNPLCKSSFLNETNYSKSNLVLFYPLSHLQNRIFLPPCISDAALSVLIEKTCVHMFIPTCM